MSNKSKKRKVKARSKIRFVALSCGYAESGQTSWLLYGTPFFGNPGYDTISEAITELALDLHAKFTSERQIFSTTMCCKRARSASAEHRVCPTCGNGLARDGFDAEEFTRFVTDLHGSTCDSYGEAESFYDEDLHHARDANFWPWSWREFRDADKSEIVWIAEDAEVVLLGALLDAKPDLRKFVDGDLGSQDVEFQSIDWKNSFSKNKQPSYV